MMLFFMLYRNAIIVITLLVIAALVALGILYIKKFKKVLVLEDLKDSPKKDMLIGLRDNADKFSEYYEPLFILAAGNAARKYWVFDAWNNTVNALEGNDAFKKAFSNEFGTLNSDPAAVPQEEYPILAIPVGASKKVIKDIKKKNKTATKKAKQAAKKAKKEAKLSAKLTKNPKKAEKFAKKEEKASDKLYVDKAYKLIKYLKKAGIYRDTDETVTADETTAEKYDVIGATSLVGGAKYDVFIPFWAVVKKYKVFTAPVAEAPVAEAPVAEAPVAEAPVAEAPVAEAVVAEAPVAEAVVAEAVYAVPEQAPAVPEKKISKRKAKKLAKKQKKADKKAAKKQKKADKKAGIDTKPQAQPEFTVEETILLIAKGAIR